MSETRTATGEGVLVDEVRESPVDKYLERHRRRVLLVVGLIVLVLVVWALATRKPGGRRHHGGASGYAGWSGGGVHREVSRIGGGAAA